MRRYKRLYASHKVWIDRAAANTRQREAIRGPSDPMRVRSHERTGSDGSSVFRRPPVDLHLPVAQVNQTSSSASTPGRLSSVETSRRSTARDSAAHH